MAGFASANIGNATPFGDVVRSIGLWANSGTLDVYRLNDDRPALLGSATPARISALLTPDFYRCRGPGVGPECSYQRSRTQNAINAIAEAPPGTLSVFISDLWFSDDEVRFSPGIDLRKSFARILRDNDILIYGFKAPYGGQVGGLPSGDRNVRPAHLPFYMLIVGPRDQVRAFHENVRSSGSPWISQRIGSEAGSDELHFALFSRTASFTKPPVLTPDKISRGLSGALPWREQRRNIPQQFRVDSNQVGDSELTWDPSASVLSYAAWSGDFEPTVTLWPIDGSKCGAPEAVDLSAAQDEPQAVEVSPEGKTTIRPKQLRTNLGLGKWLVVGSLRRKSVEPRQPALAWVEEWGFAADPAGEAAARRTLAQSGSFRTMNLAEFFKLVAEAAAEAAAQPETGKPPMPFAGFATVIEIE